MTPTQLVDFKAAIVAETNATLVAARDAKNHEAIAAWYAAPATPAFTVWKTAVDADEFRAQIVWPEVAALTDLKQRTLQGLLSGSRVIVSSQNIRDAFASIFSAGATLTALAAFAKRPANRLEKLFATGTGSNGSPGVLVVEEVPTAATIDAAMRS